MCHLNDKNNYFLLNKCINNIIIFTAYVYICLNQPLD